jgi:hypothetical protein
VLLAAVLLPAPLVLALAVVALCTHAAAAIVVGRVGEPQRARAAAPLIAVRLLRGPPR